MTREEQKRQHEYLLMEFRLGEQRIIDEMKEHVAEKYGTRITSLEHWRMIVHGVCIASTIFLSWILKHDKRLW